MGTATTTWPHTETDPQRQALLAAADRLLTGKPRRSTGRMSVVQLAVEADVKYWVITQKHTDLRDHFQQLVAQASTAPVALDQQPDPHAELLKRHAELRTHCDNLEQILIRYATALNELALENLALREQASQRTTTITSIRSRSWDGTVHEPGTSPAAPTTPNSC